MLVRARAYLTRMCLCAPKIAAMATVSIISLMFSNQIVVGTHETLDWNSVGWMSSTKCKARLNNMPERATENEDIKNGEKKKLHRYN